MYGKNRNEKKKNINPDVFVIVVIIKKKKCKRAHDDSTAVTRGERYKYIYTAYNNNTSEKVNPHAIVDAVRAQRSVVIDIYSRCPGGSLPRHVTGVGNPLPR